MEIFVTANISDKGRLKTAFKTPANRLEPKTDKEYTLLLAANPVFTAIQFAPLLVDRKTPPPYVPAKRFVPETTSEYITRFVKPELTTVQLEPLLVDRKTPPPYVPAKRFVPETTNEYISRSVKPELTAVQFAPLLVDRKTPPPYVPAKRFEPETTNA
ncbi:MAG: hypothetical protein IT280_11685 [Ignavibacteria bacterium]|nr:hypothetical protein [Ignavibacteria bacterium]